MQAGCPRPASDARLTALPAFFLVSRFTRAQRHEITPLAATGDRFLDFAPYVPAIDDRGRVAFQAACRDGTNGLYLHDGNEVVPLASSADGVFAEFTSHPALNVSGQVCFYARLRSGFDGVFSIVDGQLVTHATSATDWTAIGPLGPTINEKGLVAFRGSATAGTSGIYVADGPASRSVAVTDGTLLGFQGLPVVNASGDAVFRADLASGLSAIFLRRQSALAVKIVDTAGDFSALGNFPSVNRRGTVAFAATCRSGAPGIFTSESGRISSRLESSAPFAATRGALINDAGDLVFFAQPRSGTLGLYTGDDPATDRLFGHGDILFGAPIAEFVLNPVSMNNAGQLAIRVKLADGRHFIVRADPR